MRLSRRMIGSGEGMIEKSRPGPEETGVLERDTIGDSGVQQMGRISVAYEVLFAFRFSRSSRYLLTCQLVNLSTTNDVLLGVCLFH